MFASGCRDQTSGMRKVFIGWGGGAGGGGGRMGTGAAHWGEDCYVGKRNIHNEGLLLSNKYNNIKPSNYFKRSYPALISSVSSFPNQITFYIRHTDSLISIYSGLKSYFEIW